MSDSIVTERIGRYEVVGQLAVGGMATIHLGRVVGPRGFERSIVIKRILPHLAAQPEFVDMFVDEARIVAGIRHRNVVHVHELAREDSGLFLVMEYLEGESVGGLMRRMLAGRETLEHSLAMHIVAEACAGLHAAHELTDTNGKRRGLVHRDVSPQNLFVTYTGEVKLLDFGIAKVAGRSTKTEAGQLKGKFEYMSPEQCAGKPLDRRSDVFALGIVLYELTTGRQLYKRDSELETMKAICEERPVPPGDLVDGYPPALAEICMRALARKPADRYATAADMRRDLLAAIRAGASDQVAEDSLAYLMKRLFPDRIAEKRDMLARVRDGVSIARLPEAETDVTIELPRVDRSAVKTASTAVEKHRRSRRGWFALPAALVVASALIYVLGYRPSTAPAAAAQERVATVPPALQKATMPSTALTPSPIETASDASSPNKPNPASIVLHVETIPSGAHVVIAGHDHGTAPRDISLTKTSDSIRVDVKRVGFVPVSQSIVADVDQRIVVTLSAVPRKISRPSSVAPKRTRKDDGYHRF